MFAGGGELAAAGGSEFLAAPGFAAVGSGLAVGEAEDRDFNASIGGEGKGAAKGEAFVVGVSDNAKEAEAHAAVSSWVEGVWGSVLMFGLSGYG